ncbi:hypothetical protein B0T11DRAFT_288484 [Plectosphaerella cucumerina]|uniref:DUF6594 domain-containing protein n=1 Tax=Plectosphaerella cucumerina TaxID=40658 RepID=A0A8K0X0C6_9PEZI|nr:hypothetical protein B0T11DRAFT_288484 [Plectosphaerella cucumerina]
MSGQNHTADNDGDGYWKLAQFMARSPDHAIFREFNALTILNLLRLQAELQELEDEVRDVVESDRDSEEGDQIKYWRSFSHMKDMAETSDSTRLKLLVNIGDKLEKYHAALKQVMLMKEAARPTESAQDFLRLWLIRDNLGGNFLERSGIEAKVWEEANRDDLILLQQTAAGMDRLLDLYHSTVGRFRKSKTKDGVREYSTKNVSRLGEALVVALSAVLPTVAILVLYFIPTMIWRIVGVVILTFVFATVMALTTGAKKSEVFGATAAFAAVEVVYIGSTSFGQG